MGLKRDCTHATMTLYIEKRTDTEKPFELTMKELDEEVRFVCWTFYRYSVLCSELATAGAAKNTHSSLHVLPCIADSVSLLLYGFFMQFKIASWSVEFTAIKLSIKPIVNYDELMDD